MLWPKPVPTKTKFYLIYCNHMFHSHSILKCFFPTLSTFPSSATELYNPKWTLMSVCCVWRFGIYFTNIIESIDSKLISVCLINDHLLIADLLIFVFERAEWASISLKCTKVKLLILNNFETTYLLYPMKPSIEKMLYYNKSCTKNYLDRSPLHCKVW